MWIRNLLFVAFWTTPVWSQVQVAQWIGPNPGARFGGSIEFVGDLDGDQRPDFAIAAPLEFVTGPAQGRVRIYSGRTGALARTLDGAAGQTNFGTSIAAVGDLDGDAVNELLIGAGGMFDPATVGQLVVGYAQLLSGASGTLLHTFVAPLGASAFGRAVLGGVDYDGDGVGELLIGSAGDGLEPGYVYVYSGATFAQLRRDGAPIGGSFGYALEYLDDIDGDGLTDYAAGAPRTANQFSADSVGYVFAMSGATGDVLWSSAGATNELQKGWSLARLGDFNGDGVSELAVGVRGGGGGWIACQPGSHVEVLGGANGNLLRKLGPAGTHCTKFGATVCALGDLDGDGRNEFAGGGPGWFAGLDETAPVIVYRFAPSPFKTAELDSPELEPWNVATDAWGFALAAGDVNGDGLNELLIGAPCSDAGGVDSGKVYAYSIQRDVRAYCESTPNSQGCLPTVGWSGSPSASSALPFTITASNALNQKIGYLFYGFAPKHAPYLGSWRCVASPTRRTPNQLSGGNPPPDDCSGSFSYDFNARIASGVDPALVVGSECFAQYWMRDPAVNTTVVLSDALAFRIEL